MLTSVKQAHPHFVRGESYSSNSKWGFCLLLPTVYLIRIVTFTDTSPILTCAVSFNSATGPNKLAPALGPYHRRANGPHVMDVNK